jgi:predicted RecA/RadA family phage recombinase
MKNFVKEGRMLSWTNGTGAAVSAGALVVVGSTPGVAAGDIANGADGELATEGVFTLPAVNTAAITQGAPCYYDSSAKKITPTAEDNKYVGIAWTAKAEAGTTVDVKLAVGYHPVVNEVA